MNNYFNKFNNLKIKYKKNPNKLLLLLSVVCFAISLIVGGSYAYLTYVSKTGHTTTISAGTLALNLKSEANIINLDKVLPQEDKEAIEDNNAYTFTVENTGNIGETYTIKLDNTCRVGKAYTVNDDSKTVDMCIPNTYIRAAIKEGNGSYKTVKVNSNNEIVLATGSLEADEEKNYSLKIWLDWDTPNTYNDDTKNVVYSGKLSIDYEQGKKDLGNGYTVVFNSNGGTGTMSNETFTAGQSKALTKNVFTKTGSNFLGWSTIKTSKAAEYEDEQVVSNLSSSDQDKITLYAIWNEEKYVVTQNIVNGTGESSVGAAYGEDVKLKVEPNKNYHNPVVSCTNNQHGEINGKYLVVSNVTNNTTCTVTYENMISNLTGDMVVLAGGTYTYNGQAQTPTVTVTVDGDVLTQGVNYTVTYNNNINAGTATVTVTGNGIYEGTVTKQFTINPFNLSNATIASISNQTYTGSSIKPTPAVTVKLDGTTNTTLVNNTDFTFSYSDNVNVGTATLTITGKGNYTGTKNANYTIIKADCSCTVNSIGTMTYPVSSTGAISYSCNGDGTASLTSSDTSIMTVSKTSNTVGTATALEAGTASVKANMSAGTNYNACTEGTKSTTIPLSTYTVSVTAVNGTISGDTQKTVTHGSATTFSLSPSEGYSEENPEISCSGASYSSPTLTTGAITSNTTCTITFKEITYAVTYNANTGSGTAQCNGTVTSGTMPGTQYKNYFSTLTLSSTTPECSTGKSFLGWAVGTNAATTANTWHDPGNSYTDNAAVTLYAQWYDVNSLETDYTSYVRSEDLTLSNINLSPLSTTNAGVYVSTASQGSALAIMGFTSTNQYYNPYSYTLLNNNAQMYIRAYTGTHSGTPVVTGLYCTSRTGSSSSGTLENRIKNLQNLKDDLIRYNDFNHDTASKTISVAKTSYVTDSFQQAEPSGYRALGVAGWYTTGTNSSTTFLYRLFFGDNGTIYYGLKNNYASAASSITLTVTRLLVANNRSVGTREAPDYGSFDTYGQRRLKALNDLYGEKDNFFRRNNLVTERYSENSGFTTDGYNITERSNEFYWSLNSKNRILASTEAVVSNGSSGSESGYALLRGSFVYSGKNTNKATIKLQANGYFGEYEQERKNTNNCGFSIQAFGIKY